jgi:hypothetical protein
MWEVTLKLPPGVLWRRFGFTYQHVHDRLRQATAMICNEAELIERVMLLTDGNNRRGR